jgi:protein O-mannosyl-transferase
MICFDTYSYGFLKLLKENKKCKLSFAGALLTILVLATYWNTPKNEFVEFDDYEYVVYNNLVRSPGDSYLKDLFTTPVRSNYHPLTILSYRINNNNCKTCPVGISPKPFIKGNITLHLLNSILVLILIFLLFDRSIIISFLVAALFAVHPMHVESVAWISGRKDVLFTFFFLGGLIAYVKYLQDNRWKYLWLIFSFILFVMSCLSKATAVVFPVIIILINFWAHTKGEEKPVPGFLKNAFSSKNLLFLVPFFAVSVFIGLMAYRIQSGENFLGLLNMDQNPGDMVNNIGHFSLFQRFRIACFGFVIYIIKFFVPVNLSVLHQYPSLQEFNHGFFAIILWITMVGVILIAYMVIRSLKKTKLFAFGLGFYFITIALLLQFISVGIAIFAERYTYLPYVGLSLILSALIVQCSKLKRKILLILAGCFIIMMMVLSIQRISAWRNTDALLNGVIDGLPHLEVTR